MSLLITTNEIFLTKSLLITTQQKFHRLNDHSLYVMINGKLIEQVQHAKLLGVTLDCHLTWEKHIDNICYIVNSRLSLKKDQTVSQSSLFSTFLQLLYS